MKIRVLSDLHNEFRVHEPIETGADVIVLTGDIGVRERGVIWANFACQCPTLYVAGNHEFYGGHLEGTLKKMRNVAGAHVRVLENDEFIHRGVRFLGTTGWTDYSSTGMLTQLKQKRK